MYKDEIDGLYNIEQLKNIGFRKHILWNEQTLLMEFRRDIFDTVLTLYALENTESFGKDLKKVSIKEFLEAVQKNYEDENFTYIMKNRLEAAVSFYLGREVYYDEDFFNSPTSSDPDMVYQMAANAIYKATDKIVFSKDKYKFSTNGTRNTSAMIFSDLSEDLAALEFCEQVICDDVGNMLNKNHQVDNDPDIPSYYKNRQKYSQKYISLYISNAEKVHAIREETLKYYNKIQKKLKRKLRKAENIESLVKFFIKETESAAQNSSTEDLEK